ncbi:MAG: type II secretion system F family protein [Acidobacteriota bacterium]
MKKTEYLAARLSFGPGVRQRAWRKLAAQTSHGLNLLRAVELLRARAEQRQSPLRLVYAQVLESLSLGLDLGTSLTGFASPEEIMLISAGQRSGTLPEGLQLAAGLLTAKAAMRRAVFSALAYPVFLFAMVGVVLAVVSIMVMPNLAALSSPSSWTGAAWALYALTSFVASPAGGVALMVFLGAVAGGTAALPFWTGRARQVADAIPPWSIYRLTVGCTWLYTLATMMRAGVQLSRILESILDSESTTPYLRERVLAASQEFGMGKNLGEALYDSGFDFPDNEIVDDLRVYAALPGFHLRMNELATEWMDDGVERVKRQARVLNLFALVLITGLVGLIAASIGSLQTQLLQAGGM